VLKNGEIYHNFPQAKKILDLLKKLALGKPEPDPAAVAALNAATKNGADMERYLSLLAKSMAVITGKADEKGIESLFQPGGTTDVGIIGTNKACVWIAQHGPIQHDKWNAGLINLRDRLRHWSRFLGADNKQLANMSPQQFGHKSFLLRKQNLYGNKNTIYGTGVSTRAVRPNI
jgi:hypothetical protein